MPERPAHPVPEEAPWLDAARRIEAEKHGPSGVLRRRDRLRLLRRISRRVPVDFPWCGTFVASALRAALPEVDLPVLHARARRWEGWGDPAAPQVGAILVFWHYHPRLRTGHVGFCWGEDAAAFHVLGANQHDDICLERYPKHRLTDCRWPPGLPQPGLRRRLDPSEASPFEGSWPLFAGPGQGG